MSTVEIVLGLLVVACGLWAHIHHRLEDGGEVGVTELGWCISAAALAVGWMIAHFYAHDGLPLLIAIVLVCGWAGGVASKSYFTWRAGATDSQGDSCAAEQGRRPRHRSSR